MPFWDKNLQISNISRGSKKYISLKPLWELLNDSGLPYANIKGEALSLQAFRQYGMRSYGDIDLLIKKSDLPVLNKNLLSLGFKNKQENLSREDQIFIQAFSHQSNTFVFSEKEQKTHLDINIDVFWGEYTDKRIDIEEFLSDAQEADIYGVNVKVLSPLKAIIQLFLHHYKDMNSVFLLATRKSIKRNMFHEIYCMLKNNRNDISIDKLYDVSDRYNIIPYVYYILFYTGMLFEDKILQDYISTFKSDAGERLLNCYGLSENERREWKCDFYTRLESDNVYSLIENDLNDVDFEKIRINRKVFLGE